MKIKTGPKKVTLREQAYLKFLEQLFAGRFSPGQMLTQNDISEALDIPIGPLREALKRLEAEDYVTIRPQSGIIINSIDVKELDDLYEFRKIIECEAAGRFAQICDIRVVRDLRDKMNAILDQMDLPQDEWVAKFRDRLDLDCLFHDTIVDAMGNDYISKESRRVANKMRLFRLAVYFQNKREMPSLQEHLDLLAAFEQRDSAAAANAMRTHLENSRLRALGIV